MSCGDRERWNERYRGGTAQEPGPPSDLLRLWLPRISPGRALDVACGSGRNAVYLAAHGFTVDAVDTSDAALRIGAEHTRDPPLRIRWLQRDLTDGFIPDRPYSLIVMIRYVDCALLRRLAHHLTPGGWLICEEHLRWDGEIAGPKSSQFRVRPGELARTLAELECRFMEEGLVDSTDGPPLALARGVFQAPLRPRRESGAAPAD